MNKYLKKGTAGYIRRSQLQRGLITLILFALPIGLYLIGLHVTKTNKNLFTVIAILGCLPASRQAVGLIMILMHKPVTKEVRRRTAQAAGALTGAQELVFTAYEHTTPVNALVVCGDQVVCYTPDEKTDLQYIEKHISKILSANHFTDMNVKVFKDLKLYCQRVDQLRKHPEKYRKQSATGSAEAARSREEEILAVLLAISL